MRAAAHRFPNFNLVVMLDNILDGYDGVRTIGDDTPRRDLHRLTRLERAAGRPTRRDPLDDRKRAGKIDRAHRKAVHRRARERRQVDECLRRLRGDASGCIPQGHRFRLADVGVGVAKHERLRLLECE